MNTPPPDAPVAHLELKAGLLLLGMGLVVCLAVLYLLYARGAFERTQELVLIADNSEGVVVGMNVTFSGFPIGRVRRIALSEDGNARIQVDVPESDARWLRESSVFVLERGLLGNTNIRAYSGVLSDPPLPAGAERRVLAGDATSEIPRLVADARILVANLSALTAAEAPLAASLANVQAATGTLAGPGGALGLLFGNEADAGQLLGALERSNALLARLEQVAARVDGVVARADRSVFGSDGLMRDAKGTLAQLEALLRDTRASLQKVDAVLVEAQAVGANAREATTDLSALRADVEASLRRIDHLITEVNRKWPFARDPELKLP